MSRFAILSMILCSTTGDKTQSIVALILRQFIITIILLSERNTYRGYTRIYDESLNATNRS